MKKILILLLTVLISATLFAQNANNPNSAVKIPDQEEHLSFKKIPIDGSLSEFMAKLRADGFTPLKADNDGQWMTGQFAGKTCKILIKSSVVTKRVYEVDATFDTRDEWTDAKTDYNALKAALTKKYGVPRVREVFESYAEENDSVFYYMTLGYVTWKSAFSDKNGQVTLFIKHLSSRTGCAVLQYIDAKNAAIAINELANDL